MATKRRRNDFINFILDARDKPKLTEEFLSKKTAKTLYSFFQKKGYKDIPYNDCGDILEARKRTEGLHIPRRGKPVCAGGVMGY